MPRRSNKGEILIFFAPSRIDKDSRSYNTSLINSPTTSLSSSRVDDNTYSPQTYLSNSIVSKGDYDYAPYYSTNVYYDYSPSTSESFYFKRKFAPSTDLKGYLRFAPEFRQELSYRPIIVSKFRPQPVLVSNADTLANYYNFLIRLLKVLR